jgi:hypothetical protein
LLAISVAVALVGVPWIARLFMSITGDVAVLERLTLGTVVGVRVDPSERNRVVIDWRRPIKGSA